MRAHIFLALLVTSGCKTTDPLYCDQDTPCTDPERPYCDLTGDYPASDGHGRTCIANPFDGGVEPDGGHDQSDPDAAGPRRVVQIANGSTHTCAVFNDGGMRCWGTGYLGYGGPEETVGDLELPYTKGDVSAGGPVKQAALGEGFTCVLFEDGGVRCWGETEATPGNPENAPNEEHDISLGAKAVQIDAGTNHACALLEGDVVKCWGAGLVGQLGYGNDNTVYDPSAEDPVDLGGTPIAITVGSGFSCALLEGGRVQCWGAAAAGRLGYGNDENIGDTESPSDAGDVNVGGTVTAIDSGSSHACALLEGGTVRCWGLLNQIGQPDIEMDWGDDTGETPAAAGDVTIGGEVVELAVNKSFNCARLTTGSIRCWGSPYSHGDGDVIGDDETPASAGNVSIGGKVASLADGSYSASMCAILENGDVRCWGANNAAQLGLGHTEHVGDDELPDSQDPVQILDPE